MLSSYISSAGLSKIFRVEIDASSGGVGVVLMEKGHPMPFIN